MSAKVATERLWSRPVRQFARDTSLVCRSHRRAHDETGCIVIKKYSEASNHMVTMLVRRVLVNRKKMRQG